MKAIRPFSEPKEIDAILSGRKREPWQYGISHLMWLVLVAAAILGFGMIMFQVLAVACLATLFALPVGLGIAVLIALALGPPYMYLGVVRFSNRRRAAQATTGIGNFLLLMGLVIVATSSVACTAVVLYRLSLGPWF